MVAVSFWVSRIRCSRFMSEAGDDLAGIGRQKTGEWELYNFTASNEAFLGMTSSMKGSRPGYVSSSFWRRPRCTEDFTLDRLLGGILDEV